MNPERFQSATGQSIDDNCCLLLANSSPLFYTVNPRSGISLRQQEQLGAPSILKSFRDLPGCTRLSSSLTNLDNKRTQFPLLPDINQKSMGKSLPGHHSSKRFIREKHNPPFKVNAKIRHVYTQEVTTIEGHGHNNHHSHHHREPSSSHVTICHRQTQTDVNCFPELKHTNELEEAHAEHDDDDDKGDGPECETVRKNSTVQLMSGVQETARVDASTSPLPLNVTDESPFSGCSQMNVYPPLNYVRKLEDLEKITGHIVIQRFFTRTDDAFGTWLEKQLGMTSKSVSVDTSEFENAKTAELHYEGNNQPGNTTGIGMVDNLRSDTDQSTDALGIMIADETDKDDIDEISEGIVLNNDESNTKILAEIHEKECTLADLVKCECYLQEITNSDELLKAIEDHIVPHGAKVLGVVSSNGENGISLQSKPEEDIDEVVRCTLEAYLLAPMAHDDEDHRSEEEVILTGEGSPTSLIKSEVDSGRAESILSQEKNGSDGMDDVEGNTSHDSVETVYEIPIKNSANQNLTSIETDEGKPHSVDVDILDEHGVRILQRSLSADSCIGTESSGDTHKNQTNESQSSNDIEGLDHHNVSSNELRELVDISLGNPIKLISTLAKKACSAKQAVGRQKSEKSPRTMTFEEQGRALSTTSSKSGGVARDEKTDAEDADASESESEISRSDNFLIRSKNVVLKPEDDTKVGTDLELEEVEEYGDDVNDERDAFDAMVANHLKYSRGLPINGGTTRGRARFNRGTQTTKSIELSTSGSLSPCSSSNSSFDVEIISKSKRITTASTSADGATGASEHHDMITPSNMTMAWQESGRRRSYLPTSSSSLNLLNMKFSLGKDFESEVSIRVPNKSSSNHLSSSMLLPSATGSGGKTLLSGSSRTQHNYYQPHSSRGLSSSSYQSHQANQSPTSMQIAETPDLQSLWKDVRTKLDVQVDEMSASLQETDPALHVRGNGILPMEHNGQPVSTSGTSVVKMKKNEEKIKRSLQRLKKILDD